ncbi:MAG: DUF58 domain-containing protein [Acidimicrobiia bacterium]
MSPTPRAAALMAMVALTALVLPVALAAMLMAAVLAVTITDAWLVRQVPVLLVQVSPTLSRGVTSALSIKPVGWTSALRIRQPSGPDIRLIPQEGDGGLEADVVALRRGRHVFPLPATRATGPFGLGWWFHRSGEERAVLVYPDLPAARRLAIEVRLGRFRGEGRRSRGPLGLGTELESIREYSPDDDIRQVNWRATARVGHPMSNTYRVEQDREIVCLLDCGRLMASPLPSREGRPPLTRLDAAVDVVAAMAAVADEIGDRIGVVAFDHTIRRQLSPRREGANAVLEAVYDLEPSINDSDYELAFRTVAHAKRAFVLILTDLLEETAARPLVGAMPVLSRHHAVVVASVTDPSVATALALSVPSEAAVLRQAVAVEVIEARERVAARLGGLGARVVEAAPEKLAAVCVDAYLAAKRRALL